MTRPEPTPSNKQHPHWTPHSIHSGFKHPTSQPPSADPASSNTPSSLRLRRRLPPRQTLLLHLQQPPHLHSSLLPQLHRLSHRAVNHHHALPSNHTRTRRTSEPKRFPSLQRHR